MISNNEMTFGVCGIKMRSGQPMVVSLDHRTACKEMTLLKETLNGRTEVPLFVGFPHESTKDKVHYYAVERVYYSRYYRKWVALYGYQGSSYHHVELTERGSFNIFLIDLERFKKDIELIDRRKK